MTALRATLAGVLQGAGVISLVRAFADRYSLDLNGRLPRLRQRPGVPFQILIYHRVNATRDPLQLDALHVVQFERQMAHLARHYRVMPLSEVSRKAETGDLPPRVVCVTFDDGYRDNFVHAFPILRKHAIPATIFLTTGGIGTGELLWHDQVLMAFTRTREPSFDESWGRRSHPIASTEQKREAAYRILRRLMAMNQEDRLRAISELQSALGVPEVSDPQLMLDWNQVREMRGAGIEFGSHTVSHPILSREQADRVWWELVHSKATLEAALQEEVALFAYPNGKAGDYTPQTVDLVRRAGYRCAVTTTFGTNHTGDDPYLWRRGTPWEEDASLFGLKLAFYRMADPRVAAHGAPTCLLSPTSAPHGRRASTRRHADA